MYHFHVHDETFLFSFLSFTIKSSSFITSIWMINEQKKLFSIDGKGPNELFSLCSYHQSNQASTRDIGHVFRYPLFPGPATLNFWRGRGKAQHIMFFMNFVKRVGVGVRVWVLYLFLIPHKLSPTQPTHSYPQTRFRLCILSWKLEQAKFVVGQNRLISSLLIHENYIFFVEEDKCVRINRSNIEFPFIIALECVLFDLKATWLKIPPVCEK